MCAIPTTVHVPEMRHLYAKPAAGLALLKALEAQCWAATEACFLADEAWAAKALSPAARQLDRYAGR